MQMDVGVGIDIVRVSRIEKVWRKFPNRFIERVLNPQERNRPITARFLAKRFAIKEAVSKALGVGIGRLSWQSVVVTYTALGQPQVSLTNETICPSNRKVQISLSDDGDLVIAIAFLSLIG